jgi:hypothetical protein
VVVDKAGNEVAAKSTPLSKTASVAASDTTAPTLLDYYDGGQFPLEITNIGISVLFNEALTASRFSDDSVVTFREVVNGVESESVVSYDLLSGRSYNTRANLIIDDPLAFVAGKHYRMTVKAGSFQDLSTTGGSGGNGANSNVKLTYDFIYLGKNNHGIYNLDKVSGDMNVSLLTTGDKGLTIVNLKTLRVNFKDNVKLGYYGDAITIEKKDAEGAGYTEVAGDFELSTSGKGLLIALDTALDSGSAYRVKLASHAVKNDGVTGTSPAALTTETEKVDLVAPTLATGTSGGLVVGPKLIKVYFSEKMRVNDASKIKVQDGDGTAVSVASVDASGTFVNVRLTNLTESSKQYKVVFESGGVSDDAPYRNDGLSFVGNTVLETPVSGTAPKVTRIDVPNANNSAVTITFDQNIQLLDSGSFKVQSIRDTGILHDNTPSSLRADGNAIKFVLGISSTNLRNTVKISFGEGFVALANNGEVWNAPFAEVTITVNRAAGSWTPSASEDDGLVGLGTTSDADYGF